MESRIMTYLLVEDEEEVREVFREYDDTHPELICLDVADTVDDALKKMRRLRPQAVILDLQLNDSHGEEFLLRVKKMHLKEQPCILVLTNVKDKTTHAQVCDYGASRVICKGESRYLRDGPKYVFDILWAKYPYFKVKLNMERPLPVPAKHETVEEIYASVKALCLRYADKQKGIGMDQFIHMVAAITYGKLDNFVIKDVLADVADKKFGGAHWHTLYMNVYNYAEYLWDHPGMRNLKEEYESWFHVNEIKGMPPLTGLIPFFIKQL